MQQLQRFEEGRDRVDARDAEPLQEGVGRRVRAGQRRRMRDRRRRAPVRSGRPSWRRSACSSSRARAASRSKPATLSKPSMCRPSAVTRSSSIRPSAISDRPVCAWLPAVIRKAIGRPRCLHGQVAGDVGRLRDDGDAALARRQPHAAMLVGPQQRAVGIVDQAVAVRPDDRHVAGRLDQLAPAAARRRHRQRRSRGSRRRSRSRRRRRAARSARTISMVRWRLTPTKAASGAPGRSATER